MAPLQPYALSIAEAVRLSGIGRSSIYEAIRRGDLLIRKSGRRSLILTSDFESWLSHLPMSPRSRSA
jgi:excisionase family DNA binding protein